VILDTGLPGVPDPRDAAHTPPDAEAMAVGRFDAAARRHEAQVEALAACLPRAEAERVVAETEAADAHLAEHLTAVAHAEAPEPPPVYDGIVATLQGDYRSGGASADCPSADPLASRRESDWPEPPDYSHPPTRTGELLLEMDRLIAGPIAARNQSLRRRLGDAEARAARERSLRQDAQARLVTAEARADAAEAELESARGRIAELVLTLRAVGAEEFAKTAVVVAEPVDAHNEGGDNDG
jgi:hypothetical protein